MNTTPLTNIDLKNYRRRLQETTERLTQGVAQLTAEALRPTGAEGAVSDPPAFDPTATGTDANEEVARTVLMSEEQILAEAHAALGRLDADTFGQCERCGRKIAKTRLDAVPYARNCIRCARADDSNETV